MDLFRKAVIGAAVVCVAATTAWAIYPKLSAELTGVLTNGAMPEGDARIDQSKYPEVPPLLEVRGDNINLPNGSVLTVHMHGFQIGTLVVNNKRVEGKMNTKFQVGASEPLFIRHNGADVLFNASRWKT